MRRARAALGELRPSRITEGAPFFPLFVLFGLNAVDELDRTAFGVLLPEIRDHFNTDLETMLTLIGLAAVAALLIEIPVAYYADRIRRIPIVATGASIWAGFSALTGLAPTLVVLGVARAGAGIGRAVNNPTHSSLLADYYDVSVRAKVFGVHRAANSVGQFLAPILAGLLAYAFGWRSPFVLFALPTIVFVVLTLRLRDPTRGSHERRALGASKEIAETEEAPPTFSESWRIVWQVGTLRRIWYSLPFLSTSILGLGALLSTYYDELFGLNELQRGFVFAGTEPMQLVVLALAIPVVNRLLVRDPGLGLRLVSLSGLVTAVALVGIALAPNLPVAIAMHIAASGAAAILGPTIFASLSLAIPPRARSLGFAVGSLWFLPGTLILRAIGGIADQYGIRTGIFFMVPVFVIGALILASAGTKVAADIQKVRTSTLAQSEVLAARRRGDVKLLLVRDLDVAYGGTQVLFGVDFEVDEGEIVALLGTNGAGKSTLLRAISGLVEPRAGAVIFDGRDSTFAPPNEVAARGVVQVPGGRGVFPTLTVGENLRIAGWLFRRDQQHVREATERVFDTFPALRERVDQPAGNLSGGEQQMLTLGQAFISRPRLLMIDELSLGLAPVIVSQLLEIVKAIRDQGTTIILVEQSVNVALTVAQTAYFMEKGEIRFHGPTRDLLRRPDVLRSVFLEGAGSIADERRGPGRRRVAPPIQSAIALEVRSVSKSFGGVHAVDDVSFDLKEGQILGIIGPNGAGKTTLFDLIGGYVTPDGGSILLGGDDVTTWGPHERAKAGLGRSFQDARLFPSLTVSETIAIALNRTAAAHDPVSEALHLPTVIASEAGVRRRVDRLIKLLGLGAFRDKFVSELSTGSRRIVDLACVLAHQPTVLLFDEPSSGIAQREAERLGPLLRRIGSATGASMLVIEHDMPLVTQVADELLALDLGRFVTRGVPGAVIKHRGVVASYLGSSKAAIARSGAAPRRKSRTKAKR